MFCARADDAILWASPLSSLSRKHVYSRRPMSVELTTLTSPTHIEALLVFLERVVARPQLRGSFTDADLDAAVRAALMGLVQSAA